MGKSLKKIIASAFGVGLSLFAGEKANATLIGGFDELLEPGYDAQNIIGNDGEFLVEGQTPVLRYYGGFLDSSGYVIGYFENSGRNLDEIGGLYNGDGVIGDLIGGNFTVDVGDRLWLLNNIEFNGVRGAISEMPAYTGTSDTLVVPDINLSLIGDFDRDNDVDGVDFGMWQANYPTAVPASLPGPAVPEPATLGLLIMGSLVILRRPSR